MHILLTINFVVFHRNLDVNFVSGGTAINAKPTTLMFSNLALPSCRLHHVMVHMTLLYNACRYMHIIHTSEILSSCTPYALMISVMYSNFRSGLFPQF